MSIKMQKIRDELLNSSGLPQNDIRLDFAKSGFDKCYQLMSAREAKLYELVRHYANEADYLSEDEGYSAMAEQELAELERE